MFNNEELAEILIFDLWPSQSINSNDSELHIFSKYFDIIDKDAVHKQMLEISVDNELRSKVSGNKNRIMGNTMYEEKKYALAAKLYTESILHVPRDSNEFALAVANRSAALFDMEKYKECLQDINIVLKSEYPEELRYKIFLRQSKCYLKLNMNFEVAKSIRKAEECVNKLKINKTQVLPIQEAIKEIKNQLKKQLETNVAKNEQDKNLDDDIMMDPSLKNGNNPKFLNAAQVVNVKYTKKLGRHVVASTDINEGDVLFIEEPYSFVVTNHPGFGDTCALCFHKTPNCIPCIHCPWKLYCSDKCRLSAWNMGHQWECMGQRRRLILNKYQKLSLSILFKASYDGFQTKIEDESVYGQEYIIHVSRDKLLTNKNKISKDLLTLLTKHAVWLVLYLKYYTDFFDWLYVYPNRPEGCKEDLYKFIGGQFLKYLLQIQSNGVTMFEATLHYDPKDFGYIMCNLNGLGIFLSSALLNHSCLPNAVHLFHGTKRVIKAKEHIKKGTEITINYLNKHENPELQTEERQIKLKQYSFTCTCPRCIDPLRKNSNPFLCPKCSGRAFQLQNLALAECVDCHLVFDASKLFIISNRIGEFISKNEIFVNDRQLNVIHNLITNTFYKYNVKYILYNNLCLTRYNETGQVKKCVDIAKQNLEIAKNIGHTDNISVFLNYTFFLSKYCLTLKKQNSKIYKKIYDETKETFKKVAFRLQFYTCPRNIKKYVDDMTIFLNSGYVEMESMTEWLPHRNT